MGKECQGMYSSEEISDITEEMENWANKNKNNEGDKNE